MQRLLDIGRKLSTVADLPTILYSILGTAAELTISEAATIFEVSADGKELRFVAGLPDLSRLQSLPVPVDESLAGLAFKQRQTISISDVSGTPLHYKYADLVSGFQTRSLLACPILFRGEVLGIIEVINKANGADYNGEDATILETLSAHAALVIQNARLQALLETAQEDGQRLEKMKTDFVAITSHELRTPLGLILGHSTFLREILGPEHHAQLDVIIKNAMRLKEIIESMTSVDNSQKKVAVVQRRTVSIRKLIDEVLKTVRAEAETKGVILGSDIQDSDLMVEGDAKKIGTAISNLVRNAITFTNTGGHVYIIAGEVPGSVKIAVVDDGIGIPAKDVPHIFERFYQVESHLTRKHGGMGVGLSVAKLNIELHGGRLWVESTVGKGSTFIILLPLDAAEAVAQTPAT